MGNKITKSEDTVIFTGNIPQCPFCKKPTERTEDSRSSTTLAYYSSSYDKNGIYQNNDRNLKTEMFECNECNKMYEIRGNKYII